MCTVFEVVKHLACRPDIHTYHSILYYLDKEPGRSRKHECFWRVFAKNCRLIAFFWHVRRVSKGRG